MSSGTLQIGNWVMILLGMVMSIGGPVLIYRTVIAEIEARRAKSEESYRFFNAAINLLIGSAILFAGVLFVANNLRGNPLA